MAYPKLAVDTMMGPVRSSGLLLNAIDVLPRSADEPAGDTPWWLHGAAWNPVGLFDPVVAAIDTCSPADFATTANGRSCQAAANQVPFQMFDAFQDTLVDVGPDGGAKIDQLLTDRYDQWESWAFARALVGTAVVANAATLASTAAAPTGVPFGSAATAIWNALAILETHLARKMQNGRGLLHIPPGFLGQAVVYYGVREVNGQWVTPLGNVVIADGGYVDPLKPTAAAAASAGTDWVYASGPVWYRKTGPQFIGGHWQSIDITRDTIKRWLDSYGLLVFDPAPVAAVLTSYDVN